MGYSAYVVVRSQKALEQAYDFLLKNVTPFDKLVGWETAGSHFTSYPVCGTELDYRGGDKGTLKVGYNFSGAGESGPYLYSLLRFIALRVGSKRAINGKFTRYWVYDGVEFEPVGDCATNGIPKHYPEKYHNPDHYKKILAEMNRLDKLWPLEDQ